MGFRRKRVLLGASTALVAGAALSLGLSSPGASSPGPPPASIGDQMDRAVPASILDASLTDQEGRPVTLRTFAGQAVFLVPFLTSCQEECPVTTGGLLALERQLAAQHLTSKTAIVEVTVDPGRDAPQRMAAYAKLTGVSWPLLTAGSSTIAAVWHFFGLYHQVVPEGSPPGIDWQTRQPYTYDVNHSDGFALLDPHLREHFITAGMVRGASVPKSRVVFSMPKVSTTLRTQVVGAGPSIRPSTRSSGCCDDRRRKSPRSYARFGGSCLHRTKGTPCGPLTSTMTATTESHPLLQGRVRRANPSSPLVPRDTSGGSVLRSPW